MYIVRLSIKGSKIKRISRVVRLITHASLDVRIYIEGLAVMIKSVSVGILISFYHIAQKHFCLKHLFYY